MSEQPKKKFYAPYVICKKTRSEKAEEFKKFSQMDMPSPQVKAEIELVQRNKKQ